jgi:hypothetical protein
VRTLTRPRTGSSPAPGWQHSAVDGRALDGHEVVERNRGEQMRLPVPARNQDDRLALRPRNSLRDPALERLEVEADRPAERNESHKQPLSDGPATLMAVYADFRGENRRKG